MSSHIHWERYPTLAGSPQAQTWLKIQSDLGLAQNTVDAYARALEDFFVFSVRDGFPPERATREHIARYVHDLSTRPNPRGDKIRVLDTGVGLANATLQQRLTAVRLFYGYLTEEGLREINPVGRGRYTPGRQFGGMRSRGLIPHYTKLPWIPFRCCLRRGSRSSPRGALAYSKLCFSRLLAHLTICVRPEKDGEYFCLATHHPHFLEISHHRVRFPLVRSQL